MFRNVLIRAALEVLWLTQAYRWLPPGRDSSGFALMLHHVRPARSLSFDPNALLSVTPSFLDHLLSHLIERGWHFVSVDELVEVRAAGSRRIALTLDDGYRDNLEHAWPVFRKHHVPFTIYVCPGFADRTSELWWEALERIIAEADSLAPPGEGTILPVSVDKTTVEMADEAQRRGRSRIRQNNSRPKVEALRPGELKLRDKGDSK